MIPALPVVLALTACGKDGGATRTHEYDGSVKFSITVPSELEVVPEQDDMGGGGWKNIKFISRGDHYSDILITWQPTWSYDDLLGWFKDVGARQGPVKIFVEENLPDDRGYYIHYESGVQYAKAVIRCGETGLQCMATLAKDDPEPLQKAVIAACKTLVCK